MTKTDLSQKTIEELRDCYNTHACKFSRTRTKKRPEIEFIIKQIKDCYSSLDRPLRILELGCGDGRLAREIAKVLPYAIASYTGVDISQGLLHIARQHSPAQIDCTWVEMDMLSYVEQQESESVDLIITLASYQHLPDRITRDAFVKEVYRILCYEGCWISIDRSWSRWLVKKYYRQIWQACKQWMQTFGRWEWKNVFIPFKDLGKEHQRLYHFQTIWEIKRRLTRYGLQCLTRCYTSQA